MSDRNLTRVLRAALEGAAENAPQKHPLRTPHCPPLPRFAEGVKRGWGPEYREHVSQCPYCQKMTAAQWRLEHPSIWVVAQHQAETLQDREAMRIHLEEDQCPYCRILQNSILVTAMAATIRAAKGVEGLSSRLAGGFEDLAWAGEFAGETRKSFELRAVSPDGRLIVTAREIEAGELMLYVESPDQSAVGRSVRVEILGEGKPLEPLEFKLEDRGEFGCAVEPVSLGKVEQLGRFLEHCVLVADWMDKKE